jgi:hypothetical protein
MLASPALTAASSSATVRVSTVVATLVFVVTVGSSLVVIAAHQLSGVIGLPIDVLAHADVLAPDLREPSRVIGLDVGVGHRHGFLSARSEVEPLGVVQ